MYSYFVWLWTFEGDFIRLNIACGIRPSEADDQFERFTAAVDARLEQLHKPFSWKDVLRFRIALDPAHNDPVIWSPHNPLGTLKLAGEYPGRANHQVKFTQKYRRVG